MPRTIALGYTRKSLVVAGSDPASPELQVAAVTSLAAEHRWTLELYQDVVGHNSGRSDARAGLQALMARLADRDVAAVILYSFDRLFRNARLMLQFVDAATAAGVRVISVKDAIDFSTAQGRMMFTIMSAMSEWYSGDVSEKRRAAIDQLRRGRGRHYGDAPFGTERLPHNGDRVLFPSAKPQPNGTDYECLVQLYELHAAGRLGITGISVALNDAGWRLRGRDGELRAFYAEDVRRILDQHLIYAGYVTVGRGHRGPVEILDGSHDALLPEWLTASAAASQGAKRTLARRNAPLTYALSGILACGSCGALLQGGGVRGRQYYRHRVRCPGGDKFHNRTVTIDAEVTLHLAALRPPADVAQAAAEWGGALLSGGTQIASRERARVGLERLAELYLSGDVSRDFYDQRKAELLASDQPPAADNGLVAALSAAHWGEAALEMSPAQLRNLARALYRRIIVSQHRVLRYEPLEWCVDWAA